MFKAILLLGAIGFANPTWAANGHAGGEASKPIMPADLKASPTPAVNTKLPEALAQVQAEYQKASGIQARFDQVTQVKATKQVKKALGRIWIKRPNKVRWETLEPDANILVSDGKTFWFYTPPFDKGERGQVLIRKSGQVQTKFLNALLSGSFDFEGGQITTLSANVFKLIPKKGTAGDVMTAVIEVGPTTHKIEKVSLTHSSGNETQIKLKEIKITSDIPDSMFKFTPDRNTDQMTE
jgi:outer membrane lipoprotein carrier protein